MATSRCFIFMYFLLPHWVPATWRSRAQTSMRAELPSGKVPTTRVLRRISRFSRSITLLVRIRTNNVIERLNREIRRRTRVVGTFPDGNSALMLVCARLRHVAGTQWGNKKYMNMKHLEVAIEDTSTAG